MKLAVGIVLLIAGVVWLLQGLDMPFAPESFMTGNTTWVVLGGVAVSGGIGLIWWSRRRAD